MPINLGWERPFVTPSDAISIYFRTASLFYEYIYREFLHQKINYDSWRCNYVEYSVGSITAVAGLGLLSSANFVLR